jgi:hypothetical protein
MIKSNSEVEGGAVSITLGGEIVTAKSSTKLLESE